MCQPCPPPPPPARHTLPSPLTTSHATLKHTQNTHKTNTRIAIAARAGRRTIGRLISQASAPGGDATRAALRDEWQQIAAGIAEAEAAGGDGGGGAAAAGGARAGKQPWKRAASAAGGGGGRGSGGGRSGGGGGRGRGGGRGGSRGQ